MEVGTVSVRLATKVQLSRSIYPDTESAVNISPSLTFRFFRNTCG